MSESRTRKKVNPELVKITRLFKEAVSTRNASWDAEYELLRELERVVGGDLNFSGDCSGSSPEVWNAVIGYPTKDIKKHVTEMIAEGKRLRESHDPNFQW